MKFYILAITIGQRYGDPLIEKLKLLAMPFNTKLMV